MKRLIDIIVSSVALMILTPFFIVCAVLIVVFSGRPVFFRQIRSGLRGREFEIIKFRTMEASKDPSAFVYHGDPRITSIGKILRRFSIDELPQLINVLRGNMSLVGPRPTLPYQVEQYDEFQSRRLEVKPGITGWAQVNGRASISWPERIKLDVWYVDNISIWLDIKIIFKTVLFIFKSDGLYKGQAGGWTDK